VIHLHLHIIGIKGTLGRVVSVAGLGGWIRNDRSVVVAGARVPDNYMALFEVLDECMEVVQLKSTTRVITAHVFLSSDDIQGV
jgi:hypothetical protein